MHPIVINAEIRHAPFKHIFDQDYLEAACPNFKKHFIARDSDEICYFEISPRNAKVPPTPEDVKLKNPIDAMSCYGEW